MRGTEGYAYYIDVEGGITPAHAGNSTHLVRR